MMLSNFINEKNFFILFLLNVIFCVFLMSCKDDFSMNTPQEPVEDLYEKFEDGDLGSYGRLKIYYLDFKPGEFIPIAKYAADSLHYIPAYLDVFEGYYDKYYFSYDSVDKVDLSKMSKTDRQEALYYLEKSIKYDDTSALHYKSLLDIK